jgi:hypothetical protein
MLSHVASDVALAPALRRFAASYRDEDQAAMEILAASTTVPIVFVIGADPVKVGLVAIPQSTRRKRYRREFFGQ